MTTSPPIALPEAATPVSAAAEGARPVRSLAWLGFFWLAIYAAALFSPPLLDDADATHAQAALAMLKSGDWVTLHVDGIRYLEKPPLPYWATALSMRLFGVNTFAVHLPLALTVLGLCLLAYRWGREAFNERTGLYAGAFTLTAAGTFLFTRVFIPDALLALLLAASLYCTLRAFDAAAAPAGRARLYASAVWVILAAAVLTKGLVALFFYLATLLIFAAWTRQWHKLAELRPLSGFAIFLFLAAPWHVLAGLRNTGGADGHGFFWFYFINEHVLRFLGRRVPRDYNKLPALLYWGLHLVWLFPWSFFLPAGLVLAWRKRALFLRAQGNAPARFLSFRRATVLVLSLFSGLVLVFFSLSTNQEYYTVPVYLPVLLLLAAALTRAEQRKAPPSARRAVLAAHAGLTIVGALIVLALGFGLWSSRHLPFVPDIGSVLAHRGVGGYTLSMSHFFDLTASSFAALRLPAVLATVAFAIGPALAWWLRRERREQQSTAVLIGLAAMFLMAAHIAFARFAPMLSSAAFAERIVSLERANATSPDHTAQSSVLLYGDQAYGSSIPFYLERQVQLVDGRSTSMLFGSTFPDAPKIFLSPQQLRASWGKGKRKLLFVPLEKREEVDRLLGSQLILVMESSSKALLTDRPFH